jgi:UDP-N-acetylmuramoyl-L-alanyl-D-glutamate--2,6-diaminopimelate ligase
VDIALLFGELIESLEVRARGGDPATPVEGITYDSRLVEPGFLFVAVKGFQTDGHLYVEQAVKGGAAAVVIQEEMMLPAGIAWALVPDTRLALAKASARFFGNPSTRLRLVGVTGTNGKTTTAHLIAAVYRAGGSKTGLIGTVYNRIGERILPVTHTTPESFDLQKLLAEMVDEGVDTAVMEVSSHALELERVAGCEYDVAVFTNITRDHLDFHNDMESYLAAKLKLFAGLGQPGGKTGPQYAVVNADDPAAKSVIAAAGGQVYTYGVDRPADVRAKDIRITAGGASFSIDGRWGSCHLALKLTGLFNVYNALAAFTTGAAAGIPLAAVKEALEKVDGVPGRFELVNAGQDFVVIVDYAHTPDGLENVLKTARQITRNRLITVFGCGGDRDRQKRPLMGEIAARYSDFTVLTSDNPRTEDPLEIIKEIEAGVDPAARYAVEPDRREAMRLALRMARNGDVVVIAGKGHEDYQIIGTKKIPFDDRQETVKILDELIS